MSVRIASQIFGSIAGVGAASTGLWIGISKFWKINDSDEVPSKLLDEGFDELSAETSDVVTVDKSVDVKSIETDAVMQKKEPHDKINTSETPTEVTSNPPLKVVEQPQQVTPEIKLRTHIKTINSYKWTDKQVGLDWTAVTPQEGEQKSIIYFLAEVKDYDKNNVKHLVNEFLLTTQEKTTIMKIKCDGDESMSCFPMYEFLDNSQNLDDLDFSRLVKIYNKGSSSAPCDEVDAQIETWPKYIVFVLDHDKIKELMKEDLKNFDEEYSKLNEWKKIYQKNKTSSDTSQENQKIFLSLKTSHKDEKGVEGEWEPKLEIINFLTPSFKLIEMERTVSGEVQECPSDEEED